MMRRLSSQPNRRGAAMVEMALVFPVFLTIVLGIVEFGRAMMVSQLVTNASREGARLGIITGNTNSDVTNHIKSFLTGAINVNADDIAVTITVTPAAGNNTSGNEVAGAQKRDLVTVNVSVPFSKVSYLTGNYLEGKQLVGETTMRHE